MSAEALELLVGADETRRLDRSGPRADRLSEALFDRLLDVVCTQRAACLIEQLLVDRGGYLVLRELADPDPGPHDDLTQLLGPDL
ncbi:MAG TPA: hypothetical protein VFN74_04175 [Chloroflexota bacterium]|nr:hypothetical protein [Chloroflexota bacterium]